MFRVCCRPNTHRRGRRQIRSMTSVTFRAYVIRLGAAVRTRRAQSRHRHYLLLGSSRQTAAAELVTLPVDVILAIGTPAARTASLRLYVHFGSKAPLWPWANHFRHPISGHFPGRGPGQWRLGAEFEGAASKTEFNGGGELRTHIGFTRITQSDFPSRRWGVPCVKNSLLTVSSL